MCKSEVYSRHESQTFLPSARPPTNKSNFSILFIRKECWTVRCKIFLFTYFGAWAKTFQQLTVQRMNDLPFCRFYISKNIAWEHLLISVIRNRNFWNRVSTCFSFQISNSKTQSSFLSRNQVQDFTSGIGLDYALKAWFRIQNSIWNPNIGSIDMPISDFNPTNWR